MEYEFIYSIALDLIEKRSQVKTSFVSNETVCVLMTESSSILSSFNKYVSKNNTFENVCAEKEALKTMQQLGESKIKALAVIDCTTKKPIIPCNDCKKDILNINKDNYNTLIMLPNKTFVKLYETYNITTLEDTNITDSEDTNTPTEDNSWSEGWDEGWDDFEQPTNNHNDLYANRSEYMANTGNSSYINSEKNDLNEVNTFQATYTAENTDSIYLNQVNQGKYIREGSSIYVNPVEPTSNQKSSKYFRNTSVFLKDGESLYNQRLNSLLNTTDSNNNNNNSTNRNTSVSNQSLLKRKLANLVDVEIPQEEEPALEDTKKKERRSLFGQKNKSQQLKQSQQIKQSVQVKESSQPVEQNSVEREYKYSKKELMAMAKDKKRQAKKDQKILESYASKNK